MKKDEFRCVECSEKSSELYRDYRNGILKITICVRYHITSYFTLLVLVMLANVICLYYALMAPYFGYY